MKSLALGKSTSAVEVVSISKHGFWLHVQGEEHFLPFKIFPWFKDARVASVLKVKLLHQQHLYWPDLDVDLELESIRHPEEYPLTYRPKP
ncbi:MAG: DUF2442 domain-containing protein [Acidobacteria bacterium]|nr:DUF2442 domain-containing protein [Acidobacteriota bacterium]